MGQVEMLLCLMSAMIVVCLLAKHWFKLSSLNTYTIQLLLVVNYQ